MNPFRGTVALYRKAGWGGTIPLPYKEKHPPPTGFTGHRAEYPDVEQLKKWMNAGRSNIGLRLAGVDNEFEIVGIDVDHYKKGGKHKKGGDQLTDLEKTLGNLPATWVSSSRTDGRSGIRYYRVPRGLAFRGQIDKDIECISKGYRFAVVWPSIHPEGGTYWWFPPGVLPHAEGRELWDGTLPCAKDLSILPEKWLTYLTQDKMRAESDDRIDMDSKVDEVYQWADDTFHGDEDTKLCSLMRDKLNKHKKLISEEATSHDKIVNAHMNMFHLAAEGHLGWNEALNELEAFFQKITIDRDKRSKPEVDGEIFRSRINGLRKVKAQCDDRLKIGATAVDQRCDETGMCATAAEDAGTSQDDPPDPLDDIPGGALKGCDDYETNDDGNAEHLRDMFSTVSNGVSFRYAEGHGWIIWHDGDNPHWERDELGNQIMRRMWTRVKYRQQRYVEALRADLDNQINAAGNNPTTGQNAPPQLLIARAKWQKWSKFVEANGMNRNAENALKAAKSLKGVAIDVNQLDQNPLLLGVKNGVIELSRDNVLLRRAELNDFITLNTGVAWEQPDTTASDRWQEYLQTFLPDESLREIAQIALGHCLLGGNPEKIMIVLKGAPNTGKSTMVNAIETALGDYAASVTQTIFQNHKLNPMLADSLTKRVIVCSEFDEQDELSASMVKRLTGGTDKIRAELKGSNARIEGIPQFVPILATNTVFTISGADKALQNRLFVIPFNVTPRVVKKEYANVIHSICGTAILDWLVRGFVKYRINNQLATSQQITGETEEFVSELDEIATFVAECVVKHSSIDKSIDWKNDSDWCVDRTDMYEHFNRWWVENEFQANKKPSAIAFTKRIKALGIPGSDGNRTVRIGTVVSRFWYGCKLAKTRSRRTSITSIRPRVETPPRKVSQPGSDTKSDT